MSRLMRRLQRRSRRRRAARRASVSTWPRAVVVGVLGEDPRRRRLRRWRRARSGVSAARCAGDLVAVAGDEDLAAGLEEQLDALPGVGDQAGAGAGGLEDAGGRREAVAGHALAADVQHGPRRAVEGVVVARVDVADVVARSAGIGLSPQPLPPSRNASSRQRGGGAEEELLDPRLAVRQAVAEEAEVGREPRVGRRRGGASPGRGRCRSARSAGRRGLRRRWTTGSPPP